MKAPEDVNRLMNAGGNGHNPLEDFEKALEDDPDSLDGVLMLIKEYLQTTELILKKAQT